ncbi:MAG: hypothetical protein HUK01_09170, partial [Bacteroidaceae bacterium]|nr:hypothetical protein [Bacteroidaceae bacterium]
DCVVDAHCGGIVASGEWFGDNDGCHQSYLTLSHCANYGTLNVSCKKISGGIIGFINNGAITNCLNAGDITNSQSAENTSMGGILGYVNSQTVTMSRCLNVGTVKNTANATNVYSLYYAKNGNIGAVSELYYKTGTATNTSANTTAVTEEQLKSGEVCWLLNGAEANDASAWRQTLGSDNFPVLDATHKLVFHGYKNCHTAYSNDKEALTDTPQHALDNGFCTACGESQPATKNADGVYEIANAGQLYSFAQLVNGGTNAIHGKLTADITLTGNTNGYVIGTYEHAFAGVFDGDGHTVSGVNVTTTKAGNKGYLYAGGLFGIINAPTDTTAEVKNLTIKGSVDITPGQQVYYIGGVIGIAYGTVKMSHITSHVNLTIRDCVVDAHCGGIVASGEWFGGQEEYHQSTLYLSHCANYGTLNVSCKETCGGIIGFINNGAITDCLNAGDITNCLSADNTTTAGILGYVKSTTCKMSHCLNVGAVKNTQTDGKTYSVYYADNGAIGSVDRLYYKTGTATSTSANTTAVTEEQLKSGEVCWLLNGGTAEGDIAWRQNLGSDAHPVLDTEHKRVYYGYKDCQQKIYGNDKDAISDTPQEHAYDNGFCSVCGDYQPATKNADDVYEIANAGQLYWFAQKVNGGQSGINGMLVDNIVVNDSVLKTDGSLCDNNSTFRVWTPIGYDYWYKGIFDGQGHTISGLYVNNTNMASVGLFGEIDNTAKIKNVGVVDSYFRADGRVGGIGGANCGSLSNCYNTGTVSGNNEMVGGVCGFSDGSLFNCYNTGTVSGSRDYVGGVCGNGTYANISNCYNTGAVSGNGNYVGGVCGIGLAANITHCYNTGKVTGNGYVGGVYGDSQNATITNCYNTGTVSGSYYSGGVCGKGQAATITNCYYLNTSCPQGIGSGSGEATEKTEDQFKSGEVTWLLNGGTADGDVAWRQNLGSDAFPVLDSDHGKVYFGYKCLQA